VAEKAAASVDFSWMKKAQEFGHWNLLNKSILDDPDRVDWAYMPMPDSRSLFRWSKLRLFSARPKTPSPDSKTQEQDTPGAEKSEGEVTPPSHVEFEEALNEVRHLAWLLISTETLVGSMTGIGLLGHAAEAVKAWGGKDEKPLFDRIERTRLRAAIWGSWGIFRSSSTPELVEKGLTAARGFSGACVGISETIMVEHPYAAMTESRFGKSHEALRSAVKAGQPACHFDIANRVLEKVSPATWGEVETLKMIKESDGGQDGLQWVPMLRFVPGGTQTAGLMIYTIGQPNPFRAYKELDELILKRDGASP
jgi:hypothetical protein